MISEELRSGIGSVLLAHRIGELDITEAHAIIEGLLDASDLHGRVEMMRAARRKDDARRKPATRCYALIG